MKKFFLWLASFRLRILFRTAFLLLILAVVALAVTVLQGEKQRSYKNYQSGLTKTKEQIVARLRHPSGQLALLNPTQGLSGTGNLHPVLLPFSAIDFDDQNKARHAVEMADCLIRYARHGSLCVGIGNNPWIGGFIYAAGTFSSAPLIAHEIGDKYLDGAHRMRVGVHLRGRHHRWLAPFEALPARRGAAFEGVRGRFTGYDELDTRDYTGKMPVKDFRGWVWQEAQCLDARQNPENCEKRAFFSLRLPVDELITDLLQTRRVVWPPADLDDIHVRIEVLPPVLVEDATQEAEPAAEPEGRQAAEPKITPGIPPKITVLPALFDSEAPDAVTPFSLNDLGALLQAGESLRIRRDNDERDLALIRGGKEGVEEQISPLLTRLIRRLPVAVRGEDDDAPTVVDLEDSVATPTGNYRIFLRGAADSVVNQTLSATATRLSWFVGAVMAAIVLAWIIIEMGIARRIARLTRRSRQLSRSAAEPDGFMSFDFSDLKGNDELGILANCLNHLLRRVKEDAGRERIRAAQEKEQWHAVGHEIMSPLQSLLALHGNPNDPSHRYLARMQQALRVLYGSASPSEAFQSSTLAVATLDLDLFLGNIAANAPHIGIDHVRYTTRGKPVPVYADEYSLEDVAGHLLKNADRYRKPDTPITLTLLAGGEAGSVTVKVHNTGIAIKPEWLDKIFEYGFSGVRDPLDEGNRGQGLFVAKTYMAKMGGTIRAENEEEGVSFYLELKRADDGR
ncbi:MAG: HAMP domain-containing histidine kinase [Zoogloeaceae bacterium]|jgi:signal transduction histidine kinase|nr:HAMP domain-containing histidine kinase [Zoogloeaceae bacterium]